MARLLATCPDETVRVFLKADEKLLVDVGGHRLGANSNAPEFKIVYVFNRNNPLATLKSQVYDVRKGEYDEAAIKPFLERINAAGSQHRGFVQSVYLAKETGATEAHKLERAIQRASDQIKGNKDADRLAAVYESETTAVEEKLGPPVQHAPKPAAVPDEIDF